MKKLNSSGTIKIKKAETEFAVCDYSRESIDQQEYHIQIEDTKSGGTIRIKIGKEEKLADAIDKVLRQGEESKLGANLRIEPTINPIRCIACNKKHTSETRILRIERKEKLQVHEDCLKKLPEILRNIPKKYKSLQNIKDI